MVLTATDGSDASGADSVQVGVGNQMPTASIITPSRGSMVAGGDSVLFQGSAEDGEDGELTGEALEWTSDVDGDLGVGQSLEVVPSSDTAHTVVMTATDSDGATDGDTVEVNVGDQEPTAVITSPSQDTTVADGDALTLEGSAKDPEDGELVGGALQWTSEVDGNLGTGESVEVTLSSNTTHQVVLRATDENGASGADSVAVEVTQVRSDTMPPELVSAAVAPDTLDVRDSPDTVTVTAEVTDDLSGVDLVSAQFQSPSGDQLVGFFALPRISGDEFSGTYEGEAEFPENAEAGTWELLRLRMTDNAGNFETLSTQQLRDRGGDAEVEVVSQ